MPWANGILILIIALLAMSSSISEGSSEMDAAYGAPSEDAIQFGKLLIGAQKPDSQMKTSDLGFEQSEYLSNEGARFDSTKTKLQRLGTSVHCGNDSMTLHVPGPRMPHFLVDQGEGSPVPLSEIPASCGFSLKRVRRDVSLVAPYSGCHHVRQQGGSYVLPLIIMGSPVQMSCPVKTRLPMVSCSGSGMTISIGVRTDDIYIKVDGSWQPLLLTYSKCSFDLDTVGGSLVITAPFTGSCWDVKDTERRLPLLYGNREVTLSCPVAPTTAPSGPTTTPVNDPGVTQNMFYPFPWWYPYPKGYFPNLPTTTTTTPPPPQDPMSQQMFYPIKGFNPYYFYYKGFPTVPPATTTPPPPPPQDPMSQQMFYPMYPMRRFDPYYFYYKGFPTVPPATTTTTPPPPPPQDPLSQQFFYPMYPRRGFDPYYFHKRPSWHHRDWFPGFSRYMYGFQSPDQMTTPATTTAAAQDEQYGGYPPMFYGHDEQYSSMPRYHHSPDFADSSIDSDASDSTSIYRSHKYGWK